MPTLTPSLFFDTVDVAAVFANAILGGAVARRLNLDPVGFAVLGVVSGLGGGLLRDTLLQAGLPVALSHPAYLPAALLGAAVAFVLRLRGRWTHRVLLLADVLGLGAWAATGTAKALSLQLGMLPAVMLGVVTAVGGGMIRDLVVGRVPMVFGGNTLYATSALVATLEMAVLQQAGHPTVGMAVAILSTATISLLARRRDWRLVGAEEFTERISRIELPRRLRRDGEPGQEPVCDPLDQRPDAPG